jgi:hypothetical protein
MVRFRLLRPEIAKIQNNAPAVNSVAYRAYLYRVGVSKGMGMAIQDLRQTIRRMEKREMQLIRLLQQAYMVISTSDHPAVGRWCFECEEILGPNWHQQGG